jgi:hypothetical protein
MKIKQELIKIRSDIKKKLDIEVKKLSRELGFKLSYNDYLSYMLKGNTNTISNPIKVPNHKQADKIFKRMQDNINRLRNLR